MCKKAITLFLLAFLALFGLEALVYPLGREVITSPRYSTRIQLTNLIFELGRLLGKEIDREALSQRIGDISSGVIYEPGLLSVLEAARQQGIFLCGFKLEPQPHNLRLLKRQGEPFIAYLKGQGYCLVMEVLDKGKGMGLGVKYRTPEGEVKLIEEGKFLGQWNGHIFSLPLVNILAERIRDELLPAPRGQLVIIYSYHSGEDFSRLKTYLEDLRNTAQDEKKKFIFVDELGLIPKESVISRMKNSKLSEEEAFNKIKRSIVREDELLAKGIPIAMDNPFYGDLYRYLAKHRVEAILEDLSYELWKKIVAFDDLGLYNRALREFCFGNIKSYLKLIRRYTRGFWLHNVKERDENFSRQLGQIMKENAGSIIFVLRGIGHYGLEEKLPYQDFSIYTLVLAGGKFEENLIGSQLLHIYWTNGIKLTREEERILFLRSVPEEQLRIYFKDTETSLSGATRVSKKVVSRMSEKDLIKLSRDIRWGFGRGKIRSTEELWKFIYEWVKRKGMLDLCVPE